MVVQYFSYRLQYDSTKKAWLPLDYVLQKNFQGIDFTYELEIANGGHNDSRHLGYLQGLRAEVDAILRSFPNDYEADTDAQDKIHRWTGRYDTVIESGIVRFEEYASEAQQEIAHGILGINYHQYKAEVTEEDIAAYAALKADILANIDDEEALETLRQTELAAQA